MDCRVYSLLFLAAAATLSGCRQHIDEHIDSLFPDSTTRGPIEAELTVAAPLDPARVRAGLFEVAGPAELELADGTILEAEASVDTVVSRGGKAKLDGAWNGETTFDVELLTAARITPFLPAAITGDTVTFEFPDTPMPLDHFRVIVWYDADNDGQLTLSRTGESEFARSPARGFAADDQGELYLRSVQAWPAGEDETPETWKASAAGGDEDEGYVHNDLSDRERAGWRVTIDAESQ